MIQRIQSLFLLGVVIFAFVMLIHPISSVSFTNGSNAKMTILGVKTLSQPPGVFFHVYPLTALLILTTLLAIATIFLYQKRTLQMRLCVYNILLYVGVVIMIFYYYFYLKRHEWPEGWVMNDHSFSICVVLPFVNIILLFQAFRAIRRDELLVKSYDRLR